MIDMKMKYQATIFGNFNDIEPTPDNTKTLIDLFMDKALIPSVFYEFIANAQTAIPTRRARIRCTSANGEWAINFLLNRIQIEKQATETHGANLGDLDKFCSDTKHLFNKITSQFKKRANRIALVTYFKLEDMSEETLSKTYLKLFKVPEFYTAYPPFEWDWRTASRKPITVEELDETLNIIVTINRSYGEFQAKGEVMPFDGIQVSLDINTVPDNQELRFNAQNIASFYDQVSKIHDDLCNEITEFMK